MSLQITKVKMKLEGTGWDGKEMGWRAGLGVEQENQTTEVKCEIVIGFLIRC